MHRVKHDTWHDMSVLCTQPYYTTMAIINSNRLRRLNIFRTRSNNSKVHGAKMMIELPSVTTCDRESTAHCFFPFLSLEDTGTLRLSKKRPDYDHEITLFGKFPLAVDRALKIPVCAPCMLARAHDGISGARVAARRPSRTIHVSRARSVMCRSQHDAPGGVI